eukprot:s638_g31.t1
MGSEFQACVDFLQSVAGDKACCVCYWVYLKDFLDDDSQRSLYAVADDCGCDYEWTLGFKMRPIGTLWPYNGAVPMLRYEFQTILHSSVGDIDPPGYYSLFSGEDWQDLTATDESHESLLLQMVYQEHVDATAYPDGLPVRCPQKEFEFWWREQVLHDPFDVPWRMLVVWTPWTRSGMSTAKAADQKRITYFRLKKVRRGARRDQGLSGEELQGRQSETIGQSNSFLVVSCSLLINMASLQEEVCAQCDETYQVDPASKAYKLSDHWYRCSANARSVQSSTSDKSVQSWFRNLRSQDPQSYREILKDAGKARSSVAGAGSSGKLLSSHFNLCKYKESHTETRGSKLSADATLMTFPWYKD